MSVKVVTSLYAAEFMRENKNAMLIDVRTREEWQKIGVPLIETAEKLFLLSWRLLPNMQPNPSFESEFRARAQDKNTDLFFICKSGRRSQEAAEFASKLGYINCYNVIDGFEGNNALEGWKNYNLPSQVLS